MKIVFTSCLDAERCDDHSVWQRIQRTEPNALMLLGDSIYMDYGIDPGESQLREAIDRDLAAGSTAVLDNYEAAMHARYARQWETRPGFRELLRFLAGSRGALFVTRDDHDYAWNNCVGGGVAADKRFVRDEVKQVSDRQFAQFLHVLHNPHAHGASYPPLHTVHAAPQPVPPRIGEVPVVLLDQRSFRTHVHAPNATLLGAQQTDALLQAVGEGSGLLIVAGASPLRYRSGAWRNADGSAFPEYRRFVDAAAKRSRPVLYLAGDVHHNAYGGPVEPGSSIIQIVSSGAATPRVPLLPFQPKPGNFGLLELSLAPGARDGEVRVRLFKRSGEKIARTLLLAAGRWVDPPPGDIASGQVGPATADDNAA